MGGEGRKESLLVSPSLYGLGEAHLVWRCFLEWQGHGAVEAAQVGKKSDESYLGVLSSS